MSGDSSAAQPTSPWRSWHLKGTWNSVLWRNWTGLSMSELRYSISAAQSNSSCQRKKKNSHEPSCCKDSIPSAGSSKDKHILPRFLLAPLIFCSSISRSTHCSLFGLAGMLGQDEDAYRSCWGQRDSKRYHRTAGLRQKREQAQPGSFPQPRTRTALCKTRGAQVSQLLGKLLMFPPQSQHCPPGSHLHVLSAVSNPRLESKLWQLSVLAAANGNVL